MQEKKRYNPFSTLTAFEWWLWGISALIVTVSFFFGDTSRGVLSLVASLVGVTALIFLAKGNVLGQFFIVIFALLYGTVSLGQRYYGEMITYVGMSAPIAIFSIVSWLRHPFAGRRDEVAIHRVRKKELLCVCLLSLAVAVAFYFILRALGTARLWVSTVSVTTSFLAASLSFLRSPYYALAYALNDLVLIVLWTLASFSDLSCLSMLACFVVFFANDLHGFVCWKRRLLAQSRVGS